MTIDIEVSAVPSHVRDSATRLDSPENVPFREVLMLNGDRRLAEDASLFQPPKRGTTERDAKLDTKRWVGWIAMRAFLRVYFHRLSPYAIRFLRIG
jgi:hypothetical protein